MFEESSQWLFWGTSTSVQETDLEPDQVEWMYKNAALRFVHFFVSRVAQLARCSQCHHVWQADDNAEPVAEQVTETARRIREVMDSHQNSQHTNPSNLL